MWVYSWEVDVLLECWQNQVTRRVKLQANKSTQVKNIILWGLLRGSQPFSGKLCCNHYEPHGHLELWFKLCLFCDAFCGHSIYFFFFSFIFISWRQITLQYCSGFCHTLTWISHGFTSIPHLHPPSHLPLHVNPLGLPSAFNCLGVHFMDSQRGLPIHKYKFLRSTLDFF